MSQTRLILAGSDTHYGVIFAVAVALGVAVANVIQVWLTRKALNASRDAVKAAQAGAEAARAGAEAAQAAVDATLQGVEAARDAVSVARDQLAAAAQVTRESIRSRVDQQAPRIVVRRIEPDPTVWYPSEHGNPNPARGPGQKRFALPGQEAERVFVRLDLHLCNEGTASGWVSVSGVEFLTWPAGAAGRAYLWVPPVAPLVAHLPGKAPVPVGGPNLPPYLLPPAPETLPIAPGEEPAWTVRIELECSLGVWLKEAPGERRRVEAESTILIKDAQFPGVEDSIPLTVTAWPLVIVEGHPELAILREAAMGQPARPPIIDVLVDRRRREYPHEGESP